MKKVPPPLPILCCRAGAAVVAKCFIRKVVDYKGPPPLQIFVCTVAAVVANCFIRKVVDEKGPPHCKFFVVGREPQLWQKHFWLIDCSSPCLKVIHGHWTNVRRMQFSPSFKVTVPCDLDAKKLCKARAILTPQIFWLTRFKDKGIECLNIISGQSLVTQCIFGSKQTHKRWFEICSAVFQIIIIKSIQSYKLKRA